MNKEELYYKNLLTKYKKLTIFCYSSDYRINIVKDIINSTKTDKRPIIVVSQYTEELEERIKGDKLIIMHPNYSDIKTLKGADNHDKILIFKDGEKTYEHTEFMPSLELAMLANNIMTGQGENPLIIIESFEDIYRKYKYVKAYDYFSEVIFDELSDIQSLVLMSWDSAPFGKDSDESEDFFRIIREADAMIFTTNRIANACFGTFNNEMWGIRTILKTSNEDMTDMLEEFEKISTDEMRLERGLVFDFKEKTIEDFNGRPD